MARSHRDDPQDRRRPSCWLPPSVNLLIGVFLRYVMIEVTDWLDLDPIRFTWVEEVGEMLLAWLTLIGAAIGVRERTPLHPARR